MNRWTICKAFTLWPGSWASKRAPQKLRVIRTRLDGPVGYGTCVKTSTIRLRNRFREPLNRGLNEQEERCHAPSWR